MENFLNGSVAELQAAKAAIIEETRKKQDASEAEKAYLAKEKDIEAQKKFMADKISSSVRNRRSELEKVYNGQINEAKKELKSAKKVRRDARDEAVNERIGTETYSLVEENKKLNEQIHSLFKQGRVPFFCNSRFYYAMFATKAASDFLIFAIVAIVCVALIPNIVCALLDVTTVAKIFIYVGIVIFFVFIYLLIFIGTRSGKKGRIIEKVRPLRKQISLNKKLIRNTSSKIRVQDNDKEYGLENYDNEISRIDGVVTQKETNKEAAMKEFDQKTALDIKTQIESENLPLLRQMEAEADQLKAEYLSKKTCAQNATTMLAKNYTSYLGTKNATPEKIDELIAIINEGKASTIMQALDILNGEIRQ